MEKVPFYIGKPKDEEDARRMLHELSSSMHEVKTYYSIVLEEKGICLTRCVTSKVYFAPLNDELIEAYIATRSPLDKAGAYGVRYIFAPPQNDRKRNNDK